jgi:hypothetical protein
VHRPFDKLRANGGGARALRIPAAFSTQRATPCSTPFGLSLSKPWCQVHRPFDKLRANGGGARALRIPAAFSTQRATPCSTPFGLSLSKPPRPTASPRHNAEPCHA